MLGVFFLSHYFPPEVNAPANRTFAHCRSLVEMGYDVTVVTSVPDHPNGQIFPGYRNRLCQTEVRDGINVVRLITYIKPNAGFTKKIFNYLLCLFMCLLAAPFLGKTNVVLSTSRQFLNGFAGYFVSRIKRAARILEIGDLWPESLLAVSAIRNWTIIRSLQWLETFAYQRADRTVAFTNSFRSHIRREGSLKNGLTR